MTPLSGPTDSVCSFNSTLCTFLKTNPWLTLSCFVNPCAGLTFYSCIFPLALLSSSFLDSSCEVLGFRWSSFVPIPCVCYFFLWVFHCVPAKFHALLFLACNCFFLLISSHSSSQDIQQLWSNSCTASLVRLEVVDEHRPRIQQWLNLWEISRGSLIFKTITRCCHNLQRDQGRRGCLCRNM